MRKEDKYISWIYTVGIYIISAMIGHATFVTTRGPLPKIQQKYEKVIILQDDVQVLLSEVIIYG